MGLDINQNLTHLNPPLRHIEECHKTTPDVTQENQETIEATSNSGNNLETVIYFLTEEGEEAMLVTEDIGVEEEVIDDTAVADTPEWVLKDD